MTAKTDETEVKISFAVEIVEIQLNYCQRNKGLHLNALLVKTVKT